MPDTWLYQITHGTIEEWTASEDIAFDRQLVSVEVAGSRFLRIGDGITPIYLLSDYAAQGPVGPMGIQGITGPQGVDGIPGIAGPVGPVGSAAPSFISNQFNGNPQVGEIVGGMFFPLDMTIPADFVGSGGVVYTDAPILQPVIFDVVADAIAIGQITIASDKTFSYMTVANTSVLITGGTDLTFQCIQASVGIVGIRFTTKVVI